MQFAKRKRNVQEIVVKRPRSVNRKRCERLSICLTPDEKKMIQSQANTAGMSMTDFIVASVRNERITVITGLTEMLLELVRQGRNLNQIARSLNSGGYISSSELGNTCKACQKAYFELVHLVDECNVRIKREENQNAGS